MLSNKCRFFMPTATHSNVDRRHGLVAETIIRSEVRNSIPTLSFEIGFIGHLSPLRAVFISQLQKLCKQQDKLNRVKEKSCIKISNHIVDRTNMKTFHSLKETSHRNEYYTALAVNKAVSDIKIVQKEGWKAYWRLRNKSREEKENNNSFTRDRRESVASRESIDEESSGSLRINKLKNKRVKCILPHDIPAIIILPANSPHPIPQIPNFEHLYTHTHTHTHIHTHRHTHILTHTRMHTH